MENIGDLRLEIDELRLREEWQGQPMLVLTWSGQHANAVLVSDQKKAEYELARARVQREVRDNPQNYGVSKVTESAISAAVIESPLVIKSLSEFHAAKHAAAVLSGVMSALEDRRRALQKIVDIESREWYSASDSTTLPRGVRTSQNGGSDG